MTAGSAGPGAQAWVLASGNEGKLREFRALFSGTGLSIRSQAEFGVEPPAEEGTTFVENALAKARHAARLTGLPAIADDSGLVVDALDGAPGVRSARFAGDEADSAANTALLLARLGNIPEPDRRACFHCVIVAITDPADAAPVIGHGVWQGWIAAAPRGTDGFGYDPVFVDAELGLTAAELPLAEKNRISHRARALAALLAGLGRGRRWGT
jgi:XTP/dITP diphosphohydrolase